MQAEQQNCLEQLTVIVDHLSHIRRMINENQYCPDILQQTYRLRKKIEKLEAIILEHHLSTCVSIGIRAGDTERVITELVQMYHLVGNR